MNETAKHMAECQERGKKDILYCDDYGFIYNNNKKLKGRE